MRVVLYVLGVLLILSGCVWVLQGINVLPGSFMSGQMKWTAYGALALIAGIGLVITANRWKRVDSGARRPS